MKKSFLFLCALFFLSGCTGSSEQSQNKEENTTLPEKESSYTHTSWKEIIPPTCISFSDGCNTCHRAPDSSEAACTKKACTNYEKPYCLEESALPYISPYENGVPEGVSSERTVSYSCSDNHSFTLSYNERVSGDMIMTLEPNQIFLSDPQTLTGYILTQDSADSALFTEEHLSITFTSNSREEATVSEDSNVLYERCLQSK